MQFPFKSFSHLSYGLLANGKIFHFKMSFISTFSAAAANFFLSMTHDNGWIERERKKESQSFNNTIDVTKKWQKSINAINHFYAFRNRNQHQICRNPVELIKFRFRIEYFFSGWFSHWQKNKAFAMNLIAKWAINRNVRIPLIILFSFLSHMIRVNYAILMSVYMHVHRREYQMIL